MKKLLALKSAETTNTGLVEGHLHIPRIKIEGRHVADQKLAVSLGSTFVE
jgi:hypothetical protein